MKSLKLPVAVLVLTVSSLLFAQGPVHFADANLKALVEAQLGVPDPRPADMLGLTALYAQQSGVSDVTGLEYAVNLTELHLWENQIRDITPLSQLSKLSFLALADNQIQDISPLSGLTRVTQLYLYSNSISDITPLSSMVNLAHLYLHTNQVTDVSPLSGLANLTILDLGGNQISDISPLAGLNNLAALLLYGNQVRDVSGLAGLIHLQELYLHANQIGDISPLSGLTSLVKLHLWQNQIGSVSPLAGMTGLTELVLHENQIQDITPLSGLSNLQSLYLYFNQITDVTALSELTNLVTLDLSDNQIQDITPLVGLTNLIMLELGNNQISEVSPLSELENLESLYLYGNQIEDILPLSDLNKLLLLDLRHNQVNQVLSLLPLVNLMSLDLTGNQISDISALVELEGWQVLSLNENPLDANAYCTDLHGLTSHGNYAEYDPNPNPPGHVTASRETGTSRVQVTWEAVCNGPSYSTYYQVYRSTTPNAGPTAISSWQSATAFVDETADPAISYYYWVRAAANMQGSLGRTGFSLPTAGPAPEYVDLFDAGASHRGFTPQTLHAGQDLEVYTRIENSGTIASGPFALDLYLSLDARLDPNDHHLVRVDMPTIEPGAAADLRGIGVVGESVPAGNYHVGWVIDQDNRVTESNEANNQTYHEAYQLVVSPAPVPSPLPNPMVWATEPFSMGADSISMTAAQATHVSGVEYFFDCITDGGHDSGWQSSPAYVDTGLPAETQFTYRVKARAQGQESETDWSPAKSATTQSLRDLTPPSPDPLTWAMQPQATGASSIAMTATTAQDASEGIQYFFEARTSGGHDSGWQTSPAYEDRDLNPNTIYQYRVMARDIHGNQTSYSSTASATTASVPKPLYVIGNAVLSQEATIKRYVAVPEGPIEHTGDSLIPARCQGPIDLALTRDGRYMFTVSECSPWVQVIDTAGMTLVTEAFISGTQEDFAGVAFDPARGLVYCIDRGQDQLYMRQWESVGLSLLPAETGPITLPGTATTDIALDASNDLLYVSSGTNQVQVYSTDDWSLTQTLTLPYNIECLDIDDAKQLLYGGAQVSGDPYLLQYDLRSGSVKTRKAGTEARVVGIAVDDGTSLVYVATQHPFYVVSANLVSVFDVQLNTKGQAQIDGAVAGLGLPMEGIAYSPLVVSKAIVGGTELMSGRHHAAGGDIITYEICVTNKNTGAVASAQLIDELPAQVAFVDAELFGGDNDMQGGYDPLAHTYEIDLQTLDPNALRCALIRVKLSDDLVPGLTISNEVVADSLQTPKAAARAECIVRHAALGLTKRIAADPNHAWVDGLYYVDRGALVTYELCYTNSNQGPVTSVTMIDHLPEAAAWVAADLDGVNGYYDPALHAYIWHYPRLEANASECLQITVLMREDLAPGEQFTNRASIQGHEVPETWASVDMVTKYDPLHVSKLIVAGAQANPVPGLPDIVFAGDTITYRLSVENAGRNPAVSDITITDHLPSELAYVSSSHAGVYDPLTHTYELGLAALEPNSLYQAQITARLKQDVASGAIISNQVTAHGSQTPMALGQVAFLAHHRSLSLTKTVIEDPSHLVINGIPHVDRESLLTYELCCTNNSLASVTDVMIVDHLPDTVTWIGADLDGIDGHYDATTHTYTWQYPMIAPQESHCLQVTVLVHGNLSPGQQITNRASLQSFEAAEIEAQVDVKIKYNSLRITKQLLAGGQANPVTGLADLVFPGDTLSYGLSIENPAENPIVHDVVIVDRLPSALAYVSVPEANEVLGTYDPNAHTVTWHYPSLIPTETVPLVLRARVRADAEPGRITNEISVWARELSPVSALADVTVADPNAPGDVQAALTVYASQQVGGRYTDELLAVLILPPQVTLSDVNGDLPLILDPGGAEASYQVVYASGGHVKLRAYFNKAKLVPLIQGQSKVTLRVTGGLMNGQAFFGETTVPVTPSLLLQK